MSCFSIRTFSLVMFTLTGCSCGEATPLPDAARTPDASIASDAFVGADTLASADAPALADVQFPGDVDGLRDAPSAIDAFAAPDAPRPLDAGADAPSRCPRVIESPVPGRCDGRGMMACSNWATASGGGTAASAICLETTCARASVCTGTTIDTCRCGRDPACGSSEVCVSGVAGYSCICAP